MRKNEHLRLSGAPTAHRTEMLLVTVITLAFTIISISFQLLEGAYEFIGGYFSIDIARFISNFLFLYLGGLLWLTYYRWRKTDRRNKELEDIVSSISPDVLLVINAKGLITMCNNGIERMFGYTMGEVLHKEPDLLHYDVDHHPEKRYLNYDALEKEGFHIGVATGKKKNGTTLPVEIITGRMSDGSGAVMLLRDITERKRMEEELRALSITDELTGLFNRRGFTNLLQQQAKVAQRHNRGMLLFFIDVDQMKWINDTLGHGEGDRALIETARILEMTFRSSDIIARMGGDEFAAVAVEANPAVAEVIGERLCRNIERANSEGGRTYVLSLSVGVAYVGPEESCQIDEMIHRADEAMYEVKRHKKGSRVNSDDNSYFEKIGTHQVHEDAA